MVVGHVGLEALPLGVAATAEEEVIAVLAHPTVFLDLLVARETLETLGDWLERGVEHRRYLVVFGVALGLGLF